MLVLGMARYTTPINKVDALNTGQAAQLIGFTLIQVVIRC